MKYYQSTLVVCKKQEAKFVKNWKKNSIAILNSKRHNANQLRMAQCLLGKPMIYSILSV